MFTPLLMVVEPVLLMLNNVEVADWVDEPMANKTFDVSPLLACIANLANGDEVPMPSEPSATGADDRLKVSL